MADESIHRRKEYLRTGCNSFEAKRPTSKPMSIWLEEDIWEYIKTYDIPYSKIYDMGYKRTGCMFCMFGCHLEDTPNRFQIMKKTHPRQWEYCINTLGCGKLLDIIGVPYGNEEQLCLF
jgi:3'-phosphoadenosine 5'-phosphosulfate sulfotransferase (PAPS reductase)/FAD synthetase